MFYDDGYIGIPYCWLDCAAHKRMTCIYHLSACVLTTLGKMGYTENGYGYRYGYGNGYRYGN